MEPKVIAANIRKLFIIKAIRSGMFSISVIMLFFKQNGLSTQEAIILQVLFSLAMLASEIPTGKLADKYGRKNSIVLGCILSTLAYLIYANGHGFWGFLLGEVILAFGCSFVSGADSAMLYELQINSYTKGAIKNEGHSQYWGQYSEGIVSLIGGSILALISFRLTIYCDAMLAFAAVPVALTLVEPENSGKLVRENIFKATWRTMRYALHEHLEIKWLIISSAFVSASTLNMVWFIQIYWEKTMIPIWMFGILWSTLMFTSAEISKKAHVLEEFLGRKFSLLAIIFLPILGYALLAFFMVSWAIVFMVLFYITRGLNDPVTKSYINGLISADDRATILSVRSFLARLIFCGSGLSAGWVHDAYSLQYALALSGGIFLVGGIISLFFLQKHKLLQKDN